MGLKTFKPLAYNLSIINFHLMELLCRLAQSKQLIVVRISWILVLQIAYLVKTNIFYLIPQLYGESFSILIFTMRQQSTNSNHLPPDNQLLSLSSPSHYHISCMPHSSLTLQNHTFLVTISWDYLYQNNTDNICFLWIHG